MIYSIFLNAYLIVGFVCALIFLEAEVRQNPTGFVGGALSKLNLLERLFFYMMPFVRDIYLIIMALEFYRPSWFKNDI